MFVLKEFYFNNIINILNVSDFFNYLVSLLVIINNVVYFFDGDNNSILLLIDIISRVYKFNLVLVKVINMIIVNNIIYFVD